MRRIDDFFSSSSMRTFSLNRKTMILSIAVCDLRRAAAQLSDTDELDIKLETDEPYDLRLLASSSVPELSAIDESLMIGGQRLRASTLLKSSASSSAATQFAQLHPIKTKSMSQTSTTAFKMLASVMGGAYTCERCGNSYARPHSLNRHKRFECGVEPKFECPICRKKSKHKHNLVLHMRTHQQR